MSVTRKNVPRPVISTNQRNGIDYIFLVILLLYLFIFMGTVQGKAITAGKPTGGVIGAILSGNASIDRLGNNNEKDTAVA